MKIQDRIVELRRVKSSELRPNPRNWRTHPEHQADAMRGILSEIGYAAALIARELPDGSLMLIDGHLRAEIMPDQIVPVLVLDVNEEESDKLLLSIDPLAAMAQTNAEAMNQLAASVETNNEALKRMFEGMQASNAIVDGINNVNDEWMGMPEFVSEVIKEECLTVRFPTVEAKVLFGVLIGQTINPETKAIWHPKDSVVCRESVKNLIVEQE